MENLLELIAGLQNKDVTISELFKVFADNARSGLGACGMALVCTEGLANDEFRVLSYIDKQGEVIIDNLDFSAPVVPDSVHKLKHRQILFDSTRPQIRQGKDYGIDPAFGDLFAQYIDVLSLPMLQHDGVHRWLLLLFSMPGKVNQVDINRGLEIATLAINYVFSVETARRLAEANSWIKRELESMRRIQQLLLPQELDNTPGIRVARLFQPHTYVGGDYYEIVSLSPLLAPHRTSVSSDIWGFMIADASGHGAAAAVEIAMFDAVLRTYHPTVEEFSGPGDVLTYANRYFFTRMLRGSFITAFVSNYDPVSRTLHYANAGHPPPFIKRKQQTDLVALQCNVGFPLGIDQQAKWQSASEPMMPGDLLVMYTDGITEAKSSSGEEFGLRRLQDCIASSPSSADVCLTRIQQAVEHHRGNMPVNDDLTLLVIEIT
jgi:sigma-B regulation protein RsbU (phosphoserine phosphatase)